MEKFGDYAKALTASNTSSRDSVEHACSHPVLTQWLAEARQISQKDALALYLSVQAFTSSRLEISTLAVVASFRWHPSRPLGLVVRE